jgi:hypothetical protein
LSPATGPIEPDARRIIVPSEPIRRTMDFQPPMSLSSFIWSVADLLREPKLRRSYGYVDQSIDLLCVEI